MNAKRISTSLLILTAITFMVVLAFRVRVGASADSIALLKTDGMTCGSCSSSITSALQSVKGVATTEVDLNRGWVIVAYNRSSVTPEHLAEKVTSAGFSSNLTEVLTPEQFRQITGREIGADVASKGCCGGSKGGGCGSSKQN